MAEPTQTTQSGSPSGPSWYVAMIADLDATGRYVEAGEFSRSGAGFLGAAFRALHDLDGPELVDGWGYLTDAMSRLWDGGQYRACVLIGETAVLHIKIPEEMHDRITRSVRDAATRERMIRTERLFAGGDTEAAIRMAETIEHAPPDYAGELRSRDEARRRLRIRASVASGLVIFCLLGFSLYSFLHILPDSIRFSEIDLGPPPPLPIAMEDFLPPPPVDPEVLRGCALAALILDMAQTALLDPSATVDPDSDMLDRLQAFRRTSSEACASIPLTQALMAEVSSDLGDAEIEAMLARILSAP